MIVSDNEAGLVASCGAILWCLSKSSQVESYFTAKADFYSIAASKTKC